MQRPKLFGNKSANWLLFAGLLLLLPWLFSKVDRGQRSLSEYWQEAKLNTSNIQAWVNDRSCYKTKSNFLGCINALRAMGRWRGAYLSSKASWVKTDQLVDLSSTEKEELQKWEALFPSGPLRVSFDGLLIQLFDDSLWLQKIPFEKVSFFIGAGMNAYLAVTIDPHTYFIPRKYYEEVVSRHEARSQSYGLITKIRKGLVEVRKVLAHSPASEIGIQRGDQIIAINGVGVEKFLPYELQDWSLLSHENTITLTVLRTREGGGNSQRDYVLRRTTAQLKNSEARLISKEKGLGYLAIHKFALGTCDAAREHLKDLKFAGLRGLILDVRDNPGGYMDEALCVTGLFVAKGTPLLEARSLREVGKVERHFSQEHEPQYRGSMVVLINSGTASAAEILAGSLRDLNRAQLLGQRTFGKGTFQDGDIWEKNEALIFFRTEGLYYFPSGWTPQLIGLQPDIVIADEVRDSAREQDLYYAVIQPPKQSEALKFNLSMKENCGSIDSLKVELRSLNPDRQINKAAELVQCFSSYQSAGN